jgi:hypothetical protein
MKRDIVVKLANKWCLRKFGLKMTRQHLSAGGEILCPYLSR